MFLGVQLMLLKWSFVFGFQIHYYLQVEIIPMAKAQDCSNSIANAMELL